MINFHWQTDLMKTNLVVVVVYTFAVAVVVVAAAAVEVAVVAGWQRFVFDPE